MTSMKKKQGVSKPPGPSIFCGSSSENARIWKSKMNDYLTHMQYTEAEKMRVIKMYLDECALIWFDELPRDQRRNVAGFWPVFERQYIMKLLPSFNYSLQSFVVSNRSHFARSFFSFFDSEFCTTSQLFRIPVWTSLLTRRSKSFQDLFY